LDPADIPIRPGPVRQGPVRWAPVSNPLLGNLQGEQLVQRNVSDDLHFFLKDIEEGVDPQLGDA
ncbi:MAG: hypothetical protein QGH33_16910, partial [Pirellulaceae bacterium]|nr:hypothetical protein [Pirellulaceae bacterium]